MTKEFLQKFSADWVNSSTEKAAQFNRAYRNSTKGSDIYSAYKRPSRDKAIAFQYCLNLMKDMDGTDMKITGAGSHIFSCAFTFSHDDNTYLCYITPSHNWVTLLD